MEIVGFVVILMLALLLIFGITFYGLKQLSDRRETAARERFPTAKIVIPGANFFGQESRGVTQMRGNGTLVVTEKELYFERWLPCREWSIPFSAIIAIEMPKSFLGKMNFRPLVKVIYEAEAGKTDSMAWLVPDAEGLKRKLESMLPQS